LYVLLKRSDAALAWHAAEASIPRQAALQT
jgi:hypothetical protein